MTKLTDKEYKTINEAMEILSRCTAQESSWQVGFNRYNDLPFSFEVTYFDSNRGLSKGQHNWVIGETFADKVNSVLEIEDNCKANATEFKKKRIKALRDELSALETGN